MSVPAEQDQTGPLVVPAMPAPDVQQLRELSLTARREIVRAIAHAEGGHLGGPLSAIDILCALYLRVLNIDPDRPAHPSRDRFILSKGHSSIALYAALALRGYFGVEELTTFDAIDSRLQGHPDMTKLPGIDMSSGSLGLGFSAAIGIALGAKLSGQTFTTYVMVGDGECNEGIIWEGAHVAAKYHLDNLITIVDLNGLQQHGWPAADGDNRQPPYQTDELSLRWVAFGWQVILLDGHDFDDILRGFAEAKQHTGSPVVIIAKTVKGKAVSFMENQPAWHSRVPTADELADALAELVS